MGPVSPRSGGSPRVKLDLTADEILVLPPVEVAVFHPYGDGPEERIRILSYDYEEIFAEKIRALAECARPRDFYDIVNLYRNVRMRPPRSRLLEILRLKCGFKELDIPEEGGFDARRTELKARGNRCWLTSFRFCRLSTLSGTRSNLMRWLAGEETRADGDVRITEEGETVSDAGLGSADVSRGKATRSHLEMIRFAAANHRLRVELDYGGATARVEPYSLRRAESGDVLLHAWDVERGERRGYRVDGIGDARPTERVFSPRYEIELTRAFFSRAENSLDLKRNAT